MTLLSWGLNKLLLPYWKLSTLSYSVSWIVHFNLKKLSTYFYINWIKETEITCYRPQSTYICRVQSSVWRLLKYCPPTPSPPSECVLPPHQRRGVQTRGRPYANAANSYLEFPACKSQKFGHWANIWPLLEKAKKFTICIGNSAPLRTFFLKNLEKFDYRFFRKQKLFKNYGPIWVTWLKISRVFTIFMWNNLGGKSALPRIFL